MPRHFSMKLRVLRTHPLLAKLCAKTDTRSGDAVGCWFWSGASWNSKSGKYPALRWDGEMRSVRRLWFELVSGRKLRPGRQLRSTCSSACVRPDHMVDYAKRCPGSYTQAEGYTVLWFA